MRIKRDLARTILTHADHTVRLDHRGSQLLGQSLINMLTRAPLTGSDVTVLAESGETVQLTSLHETSECQIEVYLGGDLLFAGPGEALIATATGPMQNLGWGYLTRIDRIARSTCAPWITYEESAQSLLVCGVTVLTLSPPALRDVLNGCARSFDASGVLYTSVRATDGHIKLQIDECVLFLTSKEREELERASRSLIPAVPGPTHQETL